MMQCSENSTVICSKHFIQNNGEKNVHGNTVFMTASIPRFKFSTSFYEKNCTRIYSLHVYCNSISYFKTSKCLGYSCQF